MNAESLKFKFIIFDLDDTLLDTSKLLIPEAAKKSIIDMIAIGFPGELQTTLDLWHTLHEHYSGLELYQKLIQRTINSLSNPTPMSSLFSSHEIYIWAHTGLESFQKPQIPENLSIDNNVFNLLNRLSQCYQLFLVTQGHPESQKAKIDKIKIMHFFKEIFIVNSLSSETKKQVFQKILNQYGQTPELFLSVGNRLCHEIASAKELGMKTCHVRHGEHKNEIPQNIFEKADWTIKKITDLEKVCPC